MRSPVGSLGCISPSALWTNALSRGVTIVFWVLILMGFYKTWVSKKHDSFLDTQYNNLLISQISFLSLDNSKKLLISQQKKSIFYEYSINLTDGANRIIIEKFFFENKYLIFTNFLFFNRFFPKMQTLGNRFCKINILL